MSAAKKIILLLWLLLVATLGNVSAFTPGTAETCVWQKSFETLATRQAEALETAGGHQENGVAGYDIASVSLLAAETAGSEAGFLKNIWCFPPGTQVLMAVGSTKAIEDIKPGDIVAADEPETAEGPVTRPVLSTIEGKAMRFIKITFDRNDDGVPAGEFEATGMHALWTKNSGWVNAEDIRVGDVLQSHEGASLRVLGTETIRGFSRTYNLTVDGVHTFFIVANGTSILVHNDPPRIHGFAPDWGTKGVHVTSEGIELGIRGAGNGVKVVPIFSGEDPAAVRSATKNVMNWLGDDTWRGKLLDRTRAATVALGQGTELERSASGSTRALEVSLERWCK